MVDRVPDPNPLEGSKAFGSFLMGILTAEAIALQWTACRGEFAL